ncbi:MAG: hypothetical protein PF569_01660 [Candidatus Woesearchaeota archaeon]|jgi:hypothetical protein|nr:hypothetical protein [Candidatus Woesearchaeota archaeon]
MAYLIKVIVSVDSTNIWEFKPTDSGYNKFSLKASEQQIKTLLRKIKAKDDVTSPNSSRGITYQQMIDEIKSDRDNIIYVWSTMYPKSVNEAMGLIK